MNSNKYWSGGWGVLTSVEGDSGSHRSGFQPRPGGGRSDRRGCADHQPRSRGRQSCDGRARRQRTLSRGSLPRADRQGRSMTAQLRSELFKQRTTRTNLALLLAMVALIAVVVLLHMVALPTQGLTGRQDQLKVVGLGTSF